MGALQTNPTMKLIFAITLVIAAVACAHEEYPSEDTFAPEDTFASEDVVPEAPAAELPQAKAKWPRWRPHAHIPPRWTPVRQIHRRVRRVDRWARRQSRAVGGVITRATKRLGSYLKRRASKLCKKITTRNTKNVHKY